MNSLELFHLNLLISNVKCINYINMNFSKVNLIEDF